MAGRGRGATLPAWMTSGAGGLAAPVASEPSWGAGGAQPPSQLPLYSQPMAAAPPPMMYQPPMPPMSMPMPHMGQGYHGGSGGGGVGGGAPSHAAVRTGKGSRRPDSPESSVKWEPGQYTRKFDVAPDPGAPPPQEILILPNFQQGVIGGGGDHQHHGGRGGGGGGGGGTYHDSSGGGARPNRDNAQQTRHARRIYVGNIPLGCQEQQMLEFFDGIVRAALPPGYLRYDDKCVISVSIPMGKQFGFVEFSTVELAAAAVTLHNLPFNYRPDMPVSMLSVKRPNDFKPELLGQLRNVPLLDLQALGLGGMGGYNQGGPGQFGNQQEFGGRQAPMTNGPSKSVPDGPNKIFVGGLPYHLTDAQVQEVLETFGQLKAFNLLRDPNAANPLLSKGYAFCEYMDPSVTMKAVTELNGLALTEGKTLTVKVATPGPGTGGGGGGGGGPASMALPQMPMAMHSLPGMPIPGVGMVGHPPMGYGMPMPGMPMPLPIAPMPGLPMGMLPVPAAANLPTRVLKLSHMVTPIELQDDSEYRDIKEDVKEECAQHGRVVQVVIPRIKDGFSAAAEGHIFVEFELPQSAALCSRALAGRKFSDRLVIVEYYDERAYASRIYG